MPRRNANAKARPYIPQAKSLKKRKTRVTHNSECDYSSMEGRRHAPDRHGVCRSCGRRYVPQQTGPTDTLLYRSRA